MTLNCVRMYRVRYIKFMSFRMRLILLIWCDCKTLRPTPIEWLNISKRNVTTSTKDFGNEVAKMMIIPSRTHKKKNLMKNMINQRCDSIYWNFYLRLSSRILLFLSHAHSMKVCCSCSHLISRSFRSELLFYSRDESDVSCKVFRKQATAATTTTMNTAHTEWGKMCVRTTNIFNGQPKNRLICGMT